MVIAKEKLSLSFFFFFFLKGRGRGKVTLVKYLVFDNILRSHFVLRFG